VRNPHAGQPFTTPDHEIAEALLDVSIPTLMLSLVHMSGDAELIRGEPKPAGLFLNEVQGYMSEEDKAAVSKIAPEVIADYRDRGCPEPEPIGAELLQEMMQWLVCEPVPEEYVPMLLEEMELDRSVDALLRRAARAADLFRGRDGPLQDVAARLFVSPRTVLAHLTHIHTKLGLKSRVQLVQEAARRA
jgi:4-hydroxyacetophenone monooxygenase